MSNIVNIRCCLLIFLLFTLCNGCTDSESSYKYPGNGIPLLSKNIEIKKLQQDITCYANQFTTIKHDSRVIKFDHTNEFNYSSSSSLYGEEFCMEFFVSIANGSCEIAIGNMKYYLSKHTIVVKQDDKTIYVNNNARIKNIGISAYGKGNESTNIYTDTKLLEVLNIKFTKPASVKIQLTDNCTGSIGPWYWIRGRE